MCILQLDIIFKFSYKGGFFMFYVSDEIPSSYKYLLDYGSNYIVLTNQSRSYGESGDPDLLSSYICYSSPSFQYLPYNYYSYSSELLTDVSSDLTNDFYYACDFPITIILSFLLCFVLLFIFNGLTRLILRGGVLFNK